MLHLSTAHFQFLRRRWQIGLMRRNLGVLLQMEALTHVVIVVSHFGKELAQHRFYRTHTINLVLISRRSRHACACQSSGPVYATLAPCVAIFFFFIYVHAAVYTCCLVAHARTLPQIFHWRHKLQFRHPVISLQWRQYLVAAPLALDLAPWSNLLDALADTCLPTMTFAIENVTSNTSRDVIM